MLQSKSMTNNALEPWLLDRLACPADKAPLQVAGDKLVCGKGHSYPVVEGVPILLHPTDAPIIFMGKKVDQLIEQAKQADASQASKAIGIDPHVQADIGATNGIMYENLIGKLTEYPIPHIQLPAGNGKAFLDLGCNWGRWCIAAARSGYRAVGIDPNPKAVFAARRVARQLGERNLYLVADARYLPFRENAFDTIYSYSVLQHFPKQDVVRVLADVRRVLSSGGNCKIQMGNKWGVRSLYHQARRGFQEGQNFDVRYWTPKELLTAFGQMGESKLSVDGFFSLNPQATDLGMLPWRFRAVVVVSNLLRTVSQMAPPLKNLADSLFITARKA